jgi:hypothetical protein
MTVRNLTPETEYERIFKSVSFYSEAGESRRFYELSGSKRSPNPLVSRVRHECQVSEVAVVLK